MTKSLVVIGSQWGDEGKGKFTDYYAGIADVVVRYAGGDNAGHSIKIGEKRFAVNLIPSGIFNPDTINIIGNGCVLNPKNITKEINYLLENGIDLSNLKISDKAHIILPYHREIDALQETRRGKDKIGTTKKGIGPAYMDKMERVGIRVCDFINEELFAEKLRLNIENKNDLIKNFYNSDLVFDFDEVYNEYVEYARFLKQYVCETSSLIDRLISEDKKVLFEGAQGILLDIDHGTYPFVTSSNPLGAVCSGAGVGFNHLNNVLGITKAYTTRVGNGPFPSKLPQQGIQDAKFFEENPWYTEDDLGTHGTNVLANHIRTVGREFGVVSKRPRIIGWFDAVAMKYARIVGGITHLSITLVDVLNGVEEVKICTGYKLNGDVIDYIPSSLEEFNKCEPIYEVLPGWDQDFSNIEKFEDLQPNLQNYLKRIEELVGAKVAIVSYGPDRSETLILDELI